MKRYSVHLASLNDVLELKRTFFLYNEIDRPFSIKKKKHSVNDYDIGIESFSTMQYTVELKGDEKL